jgi:hypothetical protein
LRCAAQRQRARLGIAHLRDGDAHVAFVLQDVAHSRWQHDQVIGRDAKPFTPRIEHDPTRVVVAHARMVRLESQCDVQMLIEQRTRGKRAGLGVWMRFGSPAETLADIETGEPGAGIAVHDARRNLRLPAVVLELGLHEGRLASALLAGIVALARRVPIGLHQAIAQILDRQTQHAEVRLRDRRDRAAFDARLVIFERNQVDTRRRVALAGRHAELMQSARGRLERHVCMKHRGIVLHHIDTQSIDVLARREIHADHEDYASAVIRARVQVARAQHTCAQPSMREPQAQHARATRG